MSMGTFYTGSDGQGEELLQGTGLIYHSSCGKYISNTPFTLEMEREMRRMNRGSSDFKKQIKELRRR